MKRYVLRTWPWGADGLKLSLSGWGEPFEVRIEVARRGVDPDCPLGRATNQY